MYAVESDPNRCKLLKTVNLGALVFYEYRPDGCHFDVHHHHRESIFHNETSTLNVLPCGSRTSINSRRPHKSDQTAVSWAKWLTSELPFSTRTDEIGFVLMCITISVSRSFTFPLKTSRENAQELRYTTSRAMYTVESDPNSCKLLKMVNLGALVFYEYRLNGCHLDVHHHHRESILHNERPH
jgi:hypothetical protein